jgi:hypothetical protein
MPAFSPSEGPAQLEIGTSTFALPVGTAASAMSRPAAT